jgi:EAL domain-containing protein (putative c-di-GMP-specific phosphodiesterase class I)/GGDEF domain-containing protein
LEDASGSASEGDGERGLLRTENERLKRRVAELERKLSLQPQTGLPTHFRLDLELDELIDSFRSRGDRKGFTLLIVQLGDDYRAVRKTVKSGVSEWILYQTACRLSALLRPADLVFHTHENEFVLLVNDLKGKPLASFLGALISRLGEPHVFSGFKVNIRSVVGAAYWPEHGEDRSSLLHHADIAVGAAVERRRSFVLFKPELLKAAVEKVELQNSIIRAIEKPVMERLGDQFLLHYQPKLFCSALEGDVLSVDRVEAEVLIRWNHPSKGLIMPSAFIPLAEETGLIIPLGKWLIYQCVQAQAAWKRAGKSGIGLSLNLSAQQFRSSEAVEVLRSAIASAGADPADLTVEITETCLFEDPCAAAVMLERFEALGVRLSVDDFGTGFSSLSHLHRFPLDEIKIDRLFIENLASNRQDRIIVRTLVSLARGLGLSLVAEGVEKPEALEILWEMGCRAFQGYLISRPLSAPDFLAFRDRVVAEGYRFRLPD